MTASRKESILENIIGKKQSPSKKFYTHSKCAMVFPSGSLMLSWCKGAVALSDRVGFGIQQSFTGQKGR